MFEFNSVQQLFLVLFSILYGVMLQSISGKQPFPLGRTLRGYKNRDGHPETKFMQKGYCESRDKEWLKKMWKKRVACSILFLNIFPIVYLWIILGLLPCNARLNELFYTELVLPTLPLENLVLSLRQLLIIAIVFWSALGVFGFYRLYHALAVCCWKSLFCDIIIERFEGVSFDATAHLVWGLFCFLVPGPVCLHLLNVLPVDPIWDLLILSVFVGILISPFVSCFWIKVEKLISNDCSKSTSKTLKMNVKDQRK